MKAVVIKNPNEICLEERPVPVPGPGFVRIKVKAAAICATDLEVVGGNIAANYPLIPGHEWSGVVDAAGSSDQYAAIACDVSVCFGDGGRSY